MTAVIALFLMASSTFAVLNATRIHANMDSLTLATIEAHTNDELGSDYLRPEKSECKYSGTVDANGRVYIFGKWLHVGLKAGTEWSTSYSDAQIDCQKGGNYECQYTTCADFWAGMATD